MSAYPFSTAYPFGQQGGYQAQQNNYQQYGNVPAYQQQSPQVMNPAIAVNQGNMQDERIWVPSAAAAEAYPIAANGFVRLWHSTQPIFYEKSADAAGRPFPMIAYEYKLMSAAATTINAPVVVTIGTGTELYPLTRCNCSQVTACGIRTRTRYSTVVSTNATGGTFKLLGNACPCPANNLTAIDGTAPAAPATPTT